MIRCINCKAFATPKKIYIEPEPSIPGSMEVYLTIEPCKRCGETQGIYEDWEDIERNFDVPSYL